MPALTKAMVFAAGLGERMRPLTLETPKPLIKIAGKTLLDYTLDNLAEAGISEAIVNTHYKAGMIEEHVKSRHTPKIILSHEPVLMETGGGVVKALEHFNNAPFFCCNTDVILRSNGESSLKKMKKIWDDDKMDMLLLLQPREKAFGYNGNGDFFIGHDGKLPPLKKSRQSPFVFTGIQIISPKLFAREHPTGAFSLNHFYKNDIQPDGFLNRIYGLPHNGEWLHIGTPEALLEAEKILDLVKPEI